MINVISLVLFNTMFFVCNIFPKHIIEINSPLSVFPILFNLLFYLFFSVFLTISITTNKNFFSKYVFLSLGNFNKSFLIKRIVGVFLTQIISDIILILSTPILSEYAILMHDFLTIATWIIIYNICATKENNMFYKKKAYIIIILSVILVAVSYLINFKIIEAYSFTVDKYYVYSTQAKIRIGNLDFLFQLKNFMLDTFIGILLVISHNLLNKTNKDKEDRIVVKQIIRSFFLILIALLLMRIKYLLVPTNCLNDINIKGDKTESYTQTNRFIANTEVISVSRIGYNHTKNPVYSKTKNQLYYNGNIISEFYTDDNTSSFSYEIQGNKMTMHDAFQRIDNETETYLYKNYAICFLQDNKPIVVQADSRQIKYYESLKIVFEKLIKDYNWEFFECASKYLLKYDPEFIKPYIERYLSDEFTEEELVSMDEMCINKNYIQKVSNDLMRKKR